MYGKSRSLVPARPAVCDRLLPPVRRRFTSAARRLFTVPRTLDARHSVAVPRASITTEINYRSGICTVHPGYGELAAVHFGIESTISPIACRTLEAGLGCSSGEMFPSD